MKSPFGRPDHDATIKAAHIPAGEPRFLLRARDPAAASAVRAWAVEAQRLGVPIAVVEQALIQADAMDRHEPKIVPGADHLTDAERLQLEYQHGRRAWNARETDATNLAALMAERRGWDAAMARMRMARSEVAPLIEILETLQEGERMQPIGSATWEAEALAAMGAAAAALRALAGRQADEGTE